VTGWVHRESTEPGSGASGDHQVLERAEDARQLKTTLKAEIDEATWESLHSDTSRPFDRPPSERIAVKVINHLSGEG
jgi:hypothetical protein